MLLSLADRIVEYLKGRSYWKAIEPYVALASLYVSAQLLVYEYVTSQYQLALPIGLYLRSYIFKQLTVAFLGFALVTVIFSWKRATGDAPASAMRRALERGRPLLRRAGLAGIVIAVAVAALAALSPHQVTEIEVRFLGKRSFDEYAFTYIVYELNKRQRDWYFDVNFQDFDPEVLTSGQRARCDGRPRELLCYGEQLAGGKAFIGVTSDELGEDSFAENRGAVSVISTARWPDADSLGTYDLLTYSLIMEGILIHLNANCHGVPGYTYQQSRSARGDAFQFAPRRHAMKAMVLAAHLTPDEERLLLNCFGARYMSTVSRLVTLDWLHAPPVRNNLVNRFHVPDR